MFSFGFGRNKSVGVRRGGRIEREQIMDFAFEFVAKNRMQGGYYEFGVYEGASLIRACRAFDKWCLQAERKGWPLRPATLHAFDSFCGLPEPGDHDIKDNDQHFRQGEYAASRDTLLEKLRAANLDLERIRIHEGFFDRILMPELLDTLTDKILILHIDVDFYTSAASVLEFCTPLLQDGSLVVLDDYYCYRGNPRFGVQRAFREWQTSHGFCVEPYMNYSWAGKVFIFSR